MKRTPIKRRTPLRCVRVKAVKRPARIKPRSDRRKIEEAKYAKAKAAHFREHPACQMPGCSQSLRKGDVIDLHHKGGRNGPLLYHAKYFASLCQRHHNYVHACPSWSRANGWIIDVSSEEVRQIRLAEILAE